MGWKMKICAINSLTFILFMLYFFQINRRTKNSELRCLTLDNVIAARRETRDARRPYYVLKLTSLVVYFFTAKLFITTLTKLYFIWLATLQAFYLVNPQAQKLVHLKLNYKGESS